ncbi:unnamed protein product, partial [Closterium sp. Naga37s-1]
ASPGASRGEVGPDRQSHRGSRREERHKLGVEGGSTRSRPEEARRLTGPEAEGAGEEAERGGRGRRRGRGAIVGEREALVRLGTWRECHEQPEQDMPPTNQEAEESDNIDDGEEYVAEASQASEEISLEEEGGTARRARRRSTDRALLREDETRVALQLDIENALNSVERPAFFQALSQSSLLSLLPLVRTLYDGPFRLLVDHRLGVGQIVRSRGVRQGDPLGPLLFAAAIQPTLQSTATLLPEVAIVAYADDITIVGPRDAAYDAFINVTRELTSLGLRCNIAKSAGWEQCTGGGNEIPPP